MENVKFTFHYAGQSFEATAECLSDANSSRRYKIDFPNVQSIVEGSVYLSEAGNGEWEIEKIMSADPVHEEFLHQVSQGFVEYIDTHSQK
jgi:hypothetical protein